MNRVQAARELAVPLQATVDDIERAFRHAARRSHPDLGGDAGSFRRATEARAALLSPPPHDPVLRVVEVVVRYHPAALVVAAVVRILERRVPPPSGG